MNAISIFDFKNHQVRTAVHENGEVYFCLTDVADALEIDRTSNLLRIAKGVVNNHTLKNRGSLDPNGVIKITINTSGGIQELTFINEPNLYRVIFRSKKDEAVKFQDWVFNDVLPTLRKTGEYRITLSVEQQNALASEVRKRCQNQQVHYQTVWRAIKDHYKVENYKDILAKDCNEAMNLVWLIQLPQPQITQTNEQLAYNEMMRYRGLLQLDNINKTISELQLAALNVSQQLDRLRQLTPVINDAFAMPTYPMPVNVDEVRQLAMIRLAGRNASII